MKKGRFRKNIFLLAALIVSLTITSCKSDSNPDTGSSSKTPSSVETSSSTPAQSGEGATVLPSKQEGNDVPSPQVSSIDFALEQQKHLEENFKLLSQLEKENDGRDKFDKLRVFELRIRDENQRKYLSDEKLQEMQTRIQNLRMPENKRVINILESLYNRYQTKNRLIKSEFEVFIKDYLMAKEFAIFNDEEIKHLDGKVDTLSSALGVKDYRDINPLFQTCYNSGVTKLWAQLQIDNDLMKEDLELWGIEDDEPVAVLDSGFNKNFVETYYSSKIYSQTGYEGRGEVFNDENGHGTMVSGLIIGNENIGTSSKTRLNVYRVTKPGANSSCENEVLESSMIAACKAQNSIINVSWGDEKDESGDEVEEERNKPLMQQFLEQGCLIIKSSGNDHYLHDYSNRDVRLLEDAYLRVGATAFLTNIADFSSQGEIFAPGKAVFTFAPKKPDLFELMDNNSCTSSSGKEVFGKFTSGTSFSAPMVAGIMANVSSVLKLHPKGVYRNLPNHQKIKLLNRVAKTASLNGIINGLRAIWIAKAWTQHWNDSDIPSEAQLTALLQQYGSKACEKKSSKCLNAKTEKSIYECINVNRRIEALCDNHPEKKDNILNTFEILTQHNQLEVAGLWFHKIRSFNMVDKQKVLDGIIKMWNLYQKRAQRNTYASYNNNDFQSELILLPTYIEVLAQENLLDKNEIIKLTNSILDNASLWRSLTSNRIRGSAETLNNVIELLKVVKSILNVSDFKNILSDFLKNKGFIISKGEMVIAQIRILDTMITHPVFVELQNELKEIEEQLLKDSIFNESIASSSFIIQDLDYFKTIAPSSYVNDSPVIEKQQFNLFLARNKDAFDKMVVKALDTQSLDEFPLFWAHYLLYHRELIPNNYRAIDFSMLLLQYIITAAYDQETFSRTMYTDVFRIFKEQLAEIQDMPQKERYENRLHDLIKSNNSFSAMIHFLPEFYPSAEQSSIQGFNLLKHYSSYKAFIDDLPFNKHEIINTKEEYFLLSKKAALTYLQQSEIPSTRMFNFWFRSRFIIKPYFIEEKSSLEVVMMALLNENSDTSDSLNGNSNEIQIPIYPSNNTEKTSSKNISLESNLSISNDLMVKIIHEITNSSLDSNALAADISNKMDIFKKVFTKMREYTGRDFTRKYDTLLTEMISDVSKVQDSNNSNYLLVQYLLMSLIKDAYNGHVE
ncbi:MAG: S8/S53 family peptidase [Oligoflexia bacterium]|nr:S8/S53 family peptidase [Oligoflexia bacterium]